MPAFNPIPVDPYATGEIRRAATRTAPVLQPAPAVAPKPQTGDDAAGGSGFLNISRLLALNQDQGDRMGGQLAGDVRAEGEAVKKSNKSEFDRYAAGQGGYDALGGTPTDGSLETAAGKAENDASLAGTASGRQTLLQDKNKGTAGGYGEAASSLDSLLAGAGNGGKQLDQVSSAYQGLAQQLGVSRQAGMQQAAVNNQNAKNHQDAVDAQNNKAVVDAANAKAQQDAVLAGGIGIAQTDDPDNWWGPAKDTDVWKNMTRQESEAIQKAHSMIGDGLSQTEYHNWLTRLKASIKQRSGAK